VGGTGGDGGPGGGGAGGPSVGVWIVSGGVDAQDVTYQLGTPGGGGDGGDGRSDLAGEDGIQAEVHGD